MGRFRQLSDGDVREILAAFGAPSLRQHAPLEAGTINTNVRVDTVDGPLFLRINEGKRPDEVRHEAAVVDHAVAVGVPTPAPLRTRDWQPFCTWQGQVVSLFPWVEGRVLARAEIGTTHARQVGAALARLHQGGADFGDHTRGRYEPDEIDRRLERVKALADPDLAAGVATLEPELRTLRKLRGPRDVRPPPGSRGVEGGGLPEGLIHGDLFVDNVLFGADGRLAALLDFEQAAWGGLAYDLAVTTLAFGFGADDFRAEVTRALLDGYASVRRPTAAEAAGFGAECRFAACRFAVTRMTDVHMRRGAGAPAGKDFRRYLLRLRRIQEHLDARDGLLELPA